MTLGLGGTVVELSYKPLNSADCNPQQEEAEQEEQQRREVSDKPLSLRDAAKNNLHVRWTSLQSDQNLRGPRVICSR